MAKRPRFLGDELPKFNLGKWLKNYPIVPVLTVVFALGVWMGFELGRRPAGVDVGPRRKEHVPRVPKAGTHPRIAFVIDDIGYTRKHEDLLFSIEPPLTLAILPQLPYSDYFAKEGKKRGYEIVLHLPLEPEDQDDHPGLGTITTDMTEEHVKELLERDLNSVPGVVGVNNHMGSRATRNQNLMRIIVKQLRSRKLFFLDSLTHPRSIAFETARAAGVRALKRDVFLDNRDDFDAITNQIEETVRVAKKSKHAVAIGHFKENTIRAVREAIPRLKAQGIRFATLEELV